MTRIFKRLPLLLSLAAALSCNRDFENSMDPRSSGFQGDSLALDLDGNGRSDFLDEYAPECAGASCLDTALANRAKGIARHPRITGLAWDTLVSINDTIRIDVKTVGYYPIKRALWGRRGKNGPPDTVDPARFSVVFPDSGMKIIDLKVESETHGVFSSRDTLVRIHVDQDIPKASISGPVSIHVGQEAALEARVVQMFGSIVMYKWDDGRAGLWKDSGSGLSETKYAYGTTGVKVIRLYVRDDDGNVDSTQQSLFVVNDNPVVAPLRDTTIAMADSLAIRVFATDSDGIRKYLWDFDGDGKNEDSTEAGYHVFAYYPAVKNATTIVTVEDRFDGKTQVRMKVVVDTTRPGRPVVSIPAYTKSVQPEWQWAFSANSVSSGGFRLAVDDSDLAIHGQMTFSTNYQPPSPMTEGRHFLCVQERNKPGNWSPMGCGFTIIDTTLPPPPVFELMPVAVNIRRPTWRWRAGSSQVVGIFSYRLVSALLIDSGIVSQSQYIPNSSLYDGLNILYVREQDSAGNWSEEAFQRVIIDATPPAPPILTGTASPTKESRPSWTWSSGGSGGAGRYRWLLDSTDWSKADSGVVTALTPYASLTEGTHTLRVEERDSLGNWSAFSFFDVRLDRTPPTPPSISSIPASPTSVPRPTWTWGAATASGGIGIFRFTFEDSTALGSAQESSARSFTPASDLPDGIHAVYVQERDSAGNWSATASCKVWIERGRLAAPAISVWPSTPMGNARPIWSWLSSGGKSLYRVKLDDSSFASGSQSLTAAQFKPAWDLPEGDHTLFVEQQDSSGRWSFPGSKTATVRFVMPSEQVVDLAGADSLYRSSNGGATWMGASSGNPYNVFRSIHFIDDKNGWAVGYISILSTNDGGVTWKSAYTGTTTQYYGIQFTDNLNGWAVGSISSESIAIHTSDGGKSWVKQLVPNTSQYFTDIKFINSSIGWIFGTGIIMKTDNGGVTWISENLPISDDFNAGDVSLSGTTVWAVGNNGSVLRTLDGGITWNPVSVPFQIPWYSVQFLDVNIGWIAGGGSQGGVILKTTNGGSTWTSQITGTKSILRSIRFLDSNTGWAVGDNGTILKTVDGGITWTQQPIGTTARLWCVRLPQAAVPSPVSAPTVNTLADTNSLQPLWNWSSNGGTGRFRSKLDDSDLSIGATLTLQTNWVSPLPLNESSHTLYVQESNAAGTWSPSGGATVRIDVTPPAAPIVHAPPSPSNNAQAAWTWSAGGGGNGRFRCRIDNPDLSVNATAVNTTIFYPAIALTDGMHTLYVQERDAAGNWSLSGSATVLLDATPPQPPKMWVKTPNNSAQPQWTWVSGGGGGAGVYRFKIDDVFLELNSDTAAVLAFTAKSALSEGKHTLYVQERDSLFNWSASATSDVRVDLTPPSAPIISGPTSPANARPKWTWTSGGNGDLGCFRFKVDALDLGSGAQQTFGLSYIPASNLSDGIHILYVQEGDSAGNWSSISSYSVIVSASAPPNPPEVVADTPSTLNHRPTWRWTSGAGGNGTYRYHLNNTDSSLISGAVETTLREFTPSTDLSTGNQVLYVWERNDAGSWSMRGSAKFQIVNLLTTTFQLGPNAMQPATVLPTDGLPIIVYFDAYNGDLGVVKCGNGACSAGNSISILDATGRVGFRPSIALGRDGLPVIAYLDLDRHGLKIAKCGNAACTSGNILSDVDMTTKVGGYVAIAVPPDGLPVLSYHDSANQDLRTVKCGNTSCSGGNIFNAPDTTGSKGFFSSIAIGSDGLPVLAYSANKGNLASSFDLMILKCGTEDCTKGNTTATLDTGDIYYGASLLIGPEGFPEFVYSKLADIRLMKCGTLACGEKPPSILFYHDSNLQSSRPTIALAPGGIPTVSVSTNDLLLIRCANSSCSTIYPPVAVADFSSSIPALVEDSSGLPLIVFNYSGKVSAVKCGAPACAP